MSDRFCIFDNLVTRKLRRNATALAGASLFLLSGCLGLGEEQDETPVGRIGHVGGFFGAVAADEPLAVITARDVLSSGGTAADAAIAASFAMTVTNPANVSLAGGGVCMVHDAKIGVTETLNFIAPAGSGPHGERPTAVPTMSRGLLALHARYGRMDWRLLVSPAEQMARLGYRMSRASAADLKLAARPLFADPGAQAIFMAPDGEPYREGMKLRQLDLAGMLGKIRSRGVGVMYKGPVAKQIVEATLQAGGSLTLEDLRDYRPEWQPTIALPFGDDEIHFTQPVANAGPLMAQAWSMMETDDRFEDTPADIRSHLVLEAVKRAYAQRADYLGPKQGYSGPDPQAVFGNPDAAERLMQGYDSNRATPGSSLTGKQVVLENPGGTGMIVVDREGMAVACDFTLYNLFGTGRVAPGTGMILSAAPGTKVRNNLTLGPVMVANPNTRVFRYASTASGGRAKASSLLRVMADILIARQSVEAAVAAPRVSMGGGLDDVFAENALAASERQALQSRGHVLRDIPKLARVHALYCPSGLPTKPEKIRCAVQQDTRGNGLAVIADQ